MRNSVIVVTDGERRMRGVQTLVVLPNGTYKSHHTDVEGEACYEIHDTSLHLTVFAAADGYMGEAADGWIPAEGPLELQLVESPNGGSRVLYDYAFTGWIPGLGGGMRFRQSGLGIGGEFELETWNLAVNGESRASTFHAFNEQVELCDANGVIRYIAVSAMKGKSVLVDWWLPDGEDV